jgi:L-alanine-DL-glutamate epimerase-like enolase superfamily enzyme
VIEHLEAIPFRIPMVRGRHEGVLLVLHGDGVSGLGEAAALAARGEGLDRLLSELATRLPRSPAARAAWWMAELDLRARMAGLPAAELLGGLQRREVRCNRLVLGADASAVAQEVDAGAGAGFRTFKLKAVDSGGPLDHSRLGAAREAGGSSARLRIDFNGHPAASALPSLQRFRLEFAEQPLPAAAPIADWLALGPRVAADESLGDPDRAAELAAAGVGLAIKLATVGGPSAAVELAAVARGPVLVASSYESSIGIAAALHAACASPAEPLDCGLATRSLLAGDLASGLADGPCLRLPTGPGLGVELDRRALARYRLDR